VDAGLAARILLVQGDLDQGSFQKEVLVKDKSRMIAAVAALLFLTAAVVPARAADNMTIKTGYLTCHEAGGWGFIIGSSHKLHCTYTSNDHRTEYYTGSISKFGADIGYLQSAVILWAVAAPTKDLDPGALAGDYGGVQASVSLGVGAGANVLVGGFNKSIALQPVSVEGQNGLNVAAGIAGMNLHYEGLKPPGD
jgi:hypothetical protein